MGELFRKRFLSKIAFPPGADDASLAPKLPSSTPPGSVNLQTFLPRVRSGKVGRTMPHAASWPAVLTALPLEGAERPLSEPAVAANRFLPGGAFTMPGAEDHDVVVRGPAVVFFRGDYGRAPSFFSGGRASEACFLPPVRSRMPAAPALCVLAVLAAWGPPSVKIDGWRLYDAFAPAAFFRALKLWALRTTCTPCGPWAPRGPPGPPPPDPPRSVAARGSLFRAAIPWCVPASGGGVAASAVWHGTVDDFR
jgi:hypothetical protein